jgi:predicted metal-dependent hydrolase
MNKILSNIEVSGNKIEYFLIFKRTRYLKMYVNRKNEIVVISPKTILKRSLNNFIIKNIQKMHKAKVEKKESSYALKINDNKIIILGTTYARSTITQKKKKYEFNNNNFVIYSNTDKKTKQVLYSIYNDFCFS